MIKQSQVFGAFRSGIVAFAQAQIMDYVPKWNGAIYDIEKQLKESLEYASHQPPVAKASLEKVSKLHADSRLLELRFKRQSIITDITNEMKSTVHKRIEEMGGVISEVKEPNNNGKMVKVSRVQFPDGSTAKVPRNLHIDYTPFMTL